MVSWMGEYTLSHELVGEQQRLALISALLDPIERARLEQLGVRPGWRCLELGCGNGSIAQALAVRVAPTGHVVASDIDIAYIADLQMPCLEIRHIESDCITGTFWRNSTPSIATPTIGPAS
jgi:2-polyprenyl-3-methyl-5-hydroxy-6-metoxy-1,4-benzoquinol methylase